MFTYLRAAEPNPINALTAVAVCTAFSVSVSSVIALVVSWGAVGNWLRARLRLLKEDFRSMFRMMLGNAISGSMQRAMRRGDLLLLATIGSPTMVAIYDIAKKVVSLMDLPRVALALAVWPQVSADIAAGRHGLLRRLLVKLAGYGVVLAPIACGVVWMLAEPVVAMTFGQKYISAAPVLIILVIASVVQMLFFWGNALLLSGHRVRIQVLSTSVGLVFVLVLGWPMIQMWGAAGMAWAVVLATVAQNVIVAITARRMFREVPAEEEDYRSIRSSSSGSQV